jgi:quinol monooxygenase YgiN
MVIIRISMSVIMEKQKEVMQTLISMIEPTIKEKGCLSYQVYQDIETRNNFSLLSEWNTREDLVHHIKSDRFGILLGIRSLLHKPPSIKIHTVSNSEGMEMVNEIRNKSTLIFPLSMP